ncbi:OB-fold domain-containing protein [Acidocella sp.]|uniref:OB-fold domain-containing protein n=1 Tax=Acidocella sp. TaxID=50710 RepID=UPI0017C3E84A|nr:OB-fold domain-containing protein [Acidocella sp.]NNM57371.1 OB-fold domain-containing protein [Acidocella sp.]
MRAIAPDLFVETPDGPRLQGGRRREGGGVVFPLPQGGERAFYEPVALSPHGRLWSWTVQRFRPKSPPYAGDEDERGFRPYAVGYVELPGEVIVEARLEFGEVEPRLGLLMRLEIVPFNHGADGVLQSCYIFRAEGA